MTEDNPDKF